MSDGPAGTGGPYKDLEIFRWPTASPRGSNAFWHEHGRALVDHCLNSDRPIDVVQLLETDRRLMPALAELRANGIPVVYTHTMVRDPKGSAPVRWLKNRNWRRGFREVDGIVVSSTAMRNSLPLSPGSIPVTVIPNGVDLERFRPVDSVAERVAIRQQLGIHPSGPIILFVGHLNLRKGADLAADAWAIVAGKEPEARMVVVTPTAEPKNRAFADEVLAVLNAEGRGERVHLAGPVDRIEDYMRVADVLLFPSRREGMPNVVPEAFAVGLPCVLAPFIGLPAEFGHPGAEYLPAEHEGDSLARAILRLLDEPDTRAGVGGRAREWASSHLSLERSLDAYAHLYDSYS